VLSKDKDEFTRQANVLIAGVTCFVKDGEATIEALWRGLQRMDLLLFARVVDYAVSGEANIPLKSKLTASLVWEMSKSMRSRGPAIAQPLKSEDRFAVIATKFLWLFMYKKGPFSPERLEEEVTDEEYGHSVYRRFASITGCNDVRFDDERRSAA
jgi:hypothetical protein